MFREEIGREKKTKYLSGMNPLTVSKFESRDYVSEFQKASNLMQAWLTLKGKVKKIRRCPVNQLKLFDVQEVLCR